MKQNSVDKCCYIMKERCEYSFQKSDDKSGGKECKQTIKAEQKLSCRLLTRGNRKNCNRVTVVLHCSEDGKCQRTVRVVQKF